MGHRSYRQRCSERRARLQERAEYLTEKIDADPAVNRSYDAQERSALLWAIEQIDLFATIEAALVEDLTDEEKLHAIGAVIATRLHPSPSDLERTPGLRKTMERRRSRVIATDDHSTLEPAS